MSKFIGNALSLGMFDMDSGWEIVCSRLTQEQASTWVKEHNPTSCVGHNDTAVLISALLGTEVKMNRVSTSLNIGDELLVAQLNGPRLPEGATSLPEGAKLRWILAKVK